MFTSFPIWVSIAAPNFRMPMDALFQQAELLSVERKAAANAEQLMARLVTELLPRWLEDWRVDLPLRWTPKKWICKNLS